MKNITFAIIKPDAVKNGSTGKIYDRIISSGFKIKSAKLLRMTESQAQGFYAVHKERPFFGELTEFMSSGPCMVLALEKENAVLSNRELMGATNPNDANEGTIRKKYGISIDKNSVHGSDSVENAKIEIDFFFKD